MSFPSDFIFLVSMVHADDDYYALAGKATIVVTTVASSVFSRTSLEDTSNACATGCMRDTSGNHEGLVLQDPRAQQEKCITW